MAGIYIHIPFCKKACHYCDFHFSTSMKFKEPMIEAILKEVEVQQGYLRDEGIETIYFGGGTPSLLSKEELITILDKVRTTFNVIDEAEITLEANPDDLTQEKLQELKDVGVNRLSIGVQSFFDEHLKWMNRAHSAKESIDCIQHAVQIGFDNITLDLIYGIPNLSNEQWEANIQQAIDLNVGHISAYNLTLEENTAYANFVKKGLYKAPSDEKGAIQFQYLTSALKMAGYIQYETSNFAKAEQYSKHNSSYWRNKKYLGIGPSAHSFNGNSRQWNVANNKKYIDAISNNTLSFELEELTNYDCVNEHLLVGLRTIWGCNLRFIQGQLSTVEYDDFLRELAIQVKSGLIIREGQKLLLTEKGKLFADRISSDLFVG